MSPELFWTATTSKLPKIYDFQISTIYSWIILSLKLQKCYFVETEATPSATTAETNTMTQASVTPSTGILFSGILDKLQLFDQGKYQHKLS